MTKNVNYDKIVLGFVVYNSDSQFINRIIDASKNCFIIYLFDNTPNNTTLRDEIRDIENIKYFTCGKNAGLGYGISTLNANAYLDGYKYLMFFDQDTIFTMETLVFVNNKLDQLSNYAAVLFNNKFLNRVDQIIDCDLIINSGSVFNLKILKALDWHNINYFVDGVDYEFCLRAITAGYKIGIYNRTPGYDHVSGQEDKTYIIFGKKMRLRSYSFIRISDSICSFCKLIILSLRYFKLKFTIKFIYFFLIFVASQILVRGLNFFELKGK